MLQEGWWDIRWSSLDLCVREESVRLCVRIVDCLRLRCLGLCWRTSRRGLARRSCWCRGSFVDAWCRIHKKCDLELLLCYFGAVIFVIWEDVAWLANLTICFSIVSRASSTIRCQRWWNGFALKVVIVLAVALATWVVHARTEVDDFLVVRVSRSYGLSRGLSLGLSWGLNLGLSRELSWGLSR